MAEKETGKWKLEKWKLGNKTFVLNGVLGFHFPVSNSQFPLLPLAVVRGLESGDGAAQGFAGSLHVNFRIREAFQAFLSSQLGSSGALDVDLLGSLGALNQDDDAVGEHLSEPPIDAQIVLGAFPSVAKLAGHEFGQ